MDYSEFTSLTYEEAQEYIQGTENQKVREVMAQIVGRDSVLDVGCGNGIDAVRYVPDQYTGLDISEVLIRVAKERYPHHKFYVADAREIPEKDESFDFTICKAVLEHLPSVADALRVFRELLRVGKVALIGWHTPPRYYWTRIIRCRGHFGKMIYQNHYRWNLFDLPGARIIKGKVDEYELWIVTKI